MLGWLIGFETGELFSQRLLIESVFEDRVDTPIA